MLQVPLIIKRVQSMKLLIFPSISFYFSFRSRHSPQHSLINTGSKWSNVMHTAMLLMKVCHLVCKNIFEPKPHCKMMLGLWINSQGNIVSTPRNQTQQVLWASETTVTKITIWQECDSVVSAYWVIYSTVNLQHLGQWNCEAMHLSKHRNHRNNYIWFWKAKRNGQVQLSFQETLFSVPLWFRIFIWSSLWFSAEKILLLA